MHQCEGSIPVLYLDPSMHATQIQLSQLKDAQTNQPQGLLAVSLAFFRSCEA